MTATTGSEGFLERLRKEPLDEEAWQLWGEFAAVTPFPHPCPLSLDYQSLCCAMLSVTVWFPHVSRKCHFLSQNSPTLHLLLWFHFSFPSTDDYSYLLQPWGKLETFFFCRFTHFSFHIYFVVISLLVLSSVSFFHCICTPPYLTTKLSHTENTGTWSFAE